MRTQILKENIVCRIVRMHTYIVARGCDPGFCWAVPQRLVAFASVARRIVELLYM